MKLAPIVLFTYNRPWHTQQTVEALLANEYASESDLIIYSDAPKNASAQKGVDETRAYLQTIAGFKSVTIRIRENNFGLANNIVDGVTFVVNEYGRIIVLEDDLLTSPFFLRFLNEGLNKYENIPEVISIHGYVYPLKGELPDAYFVKGADCLGWGTWKRGWDLFESDGSVLLAQLEKERKTNEFDFNGTYPYTRMLRKQVEGKVGSWAIRWYASAFLRNKLTLYPGRSLIYHNGSDGSGTNCGISDEFDTELASTPIQIPDMDIREFPLARKLFTHYFRYTVRKSRIKSFIKNVFHL